MPKFETYDGYVWEFSEFPVIPSDRYDVEQRVHAKYSVLEHERLNIVFQRAFLLQRGVWDFKFSHIDLSTVLILKRFWQENFFKYFPVSDSGNFFRVYMEGDFEPELQRGGLYNLSVRLIEI